MDADLPYAHVPDADPGSEPDPHWLELRRTESKLPAAYMPPAMAGEHPRWARVSALVVIGVFVAATVCGVCLTYGIGL